MQVMGSATIYQSNGVMGSATIYHEVMGSSNQVMGVMGSATIYHDLLFPRVMGSSNGVSHHLSRSIISS